MSYTNRLIKYAMDLESLFCINRDEESGKYLVFINQVVFKDKYLRQNINGLGFTIEDACYDFIMKAHGGHLENYITNKEVSVI